jgi:hypothetical protein
VTADIIMLLARRLFLSGWDAVQDHSPAASRVETLRSGELDYVPSGFLPTEETPVIAREASLELVPTTFPCLMELLLRPCMPNKEPSDAAVAKLLGVWQRDG